MHESTKRFMEKLEQMKRLHLAKSADYGSDADPFANIRGSGPFANIEPWRGCLVRIADKMQRLHTFAVKGELSCEGVEDTLLDAAAYLIICNVLFDEEKHGDADDPRATCSTASAQGEQ